MPRTEIDDIFAGKSAAVATPTPSSSKAMSKGKAIASAEGTAKEKKKKKEKAVPTQGDVIPDLVKEQAPAPTAKRKAETVVDPSIALPTPAKRLKAGKDGTGKTKQSKTDGRDEGRFRDSRGTGPRRRTDEGYAVYKEDELGIQDGGGDTPLCPFDCDCCF